MIGADILSNKVIDTVFTTPMTDLLVWTGIALIRTLAVADAPNHVGTLLVC
ncbi:MAG: hypothetical protein ACE5R6_08275 [Candidatus Heimdallarchaeota archaeon]